MCSRPTVIVPLRALGVGKSRLATHLAPEQRAALARAMFADVVDALARADVDEIIVAAGDPSAADAARGLGLRAYVDGPAVASLDAAVAAAVDRVPDAEALLVVAADLPCASAEDIDRLVGSRATVALAPTHDGGTAALLRRPADVIGTAYGSRSASRHRALAEAAGVSFQAIAAPRLALDVDTWQDLVTLRDRQVGSHTAALLPDLLDHPAAAGA